MTLQLRRWCETQVAAWLLGRQCYRRIDARLATGAIAGQVILSWYLVNDPLARLLDPTQPVVYELSAAERE